MNDSFVTPKPAFTPVNAVQYLAANKAEAVRRIQTIGNIGLIKQLRENADDDGDVRRDFLNTSPPERTYMLMGLREAKLLIDLIDPSFPRVY